MTELELKVISLIKENYSNNEIIQRLEITSNRLWEILRDLRQKGLVYDRKYYFDGSTIYVPTDNIQIPKNEVSIITTPEDQQFEALLISDTHLGVFGDGLKRERLDLIDGCFDYCKQNGIHIIIHGGDFIEGLMDPRVNLENPIKGQAEQIDYAIEHYPYDKDILTFLVIGNHDYDAYTRCGQNLAIALHDRRHDIVPFGVGCGRMKIKNDSFLVTHRLMNGEMPKLMKEPHILRFNGHTHRMRFHLRSGTLMIDIPALVEFDSAPQDLHSALKVRLDFEKGYFKTILVEQYLVDYHFQKISEGIFDLNKNLKIKSDYVALEEPMVRSRIL